MLDDISLAIESNFKLDKLVLKNDLGWHLSLLVDQRLPRVYDGYDVLLKFDEGPYDRRAESLDQRIKTASKQPGLGGMENPEVEALRDELEKNEEMRESLAAQCEEISFSATVEAMKYTDKRETLLTMVIPADVIEELNDHRALLRHYAIVLDMKGANS